MFVSFCLNYAEIPQTAVAYESSCPRWLQLLSDSLYRSAAEYTPNKGDIVFFDLDTDGSVDHVGLVAGVSEDGASLKTIEGNSTGCVQYNSYDQAAPEILGYAALPENPDSVEAAAVMSDDEGVMLLAELPEDEEYIDGGTVEGTELTWTVTMDDAGAYTLRFEGEGALPDYTRYTTNLPWQYYKPVNLEFGDGITAIGNSNFGWMKFTSIDWGNVSSIGEYAFESATLPAHLTISGTVKNVESYAFFNCSYSEIELQEGIETIKKSAFHGGKVIPTVYIPSTVKEIGATAFKLVGEYIVSPDNPKYCAEDGILFDKEKKTLIDYPCEKITEEYRIPSTVEKIEVGALQETNITKLYIPNTVNEMPYGLLSGSNCVEVYIEDNAGVKSTSEWLFTAYNLETIRLPEKTQSGTDYHLERLFYMFTYPNLTSFKIPQGVQVIASMGNSTLFLPGLEMLTYDAASADIAAASILGPNTTFDLTVGPSVDNLPVNFAYFASHTLDTYFAADNAFTAAEGAFAGAAKPLSELSGELYADSQGLLYAYDKESQTAALVYCPPGVTSAQIPGSITPEDGLTCKVNAVRQDALKLARNLQNISFETPEEITGLDSHAMANCPSLTQVNQRTTVEEAEALFPNAEKGYGLFYNTGLGGAGGTGSFEAEMNGKQSLTIEREGATSLSIDVSSDGGTMEWIAGEGDETAGGYRLLTGDTLTLTASVGNTESDTSSTYRVYLRLTGEEGSLNVKRGESYSFNGQTVTCYESADPETVYLEFSPDTGTTLSIPITAVYPSPDSSGGGLTVWGVILSDDQAAPGDGIPPEPGDDAIQAYWTTKADQYKLTKSSTNALKLGVISDSLGNVTPDTSLNWQIVLEREDQVVSAYGKDYVRSADFTDLMTLPEGVSWSEEVEAAIKAGKIRCRGYDLYAGEVKIANLTLSGGSLSLSAKRIEWDEQENTAVLHWRINNSSPSTEMNAGTLKLVIYAEALRVDMSIFSPQETYSISNRVEAVVHYHYAEDSLLTSSAGIMITGGAGNIDLIKTGTTPTYFGEDVTYTLDVYNNGGLPWMADQEGVYTLRDALSQYTYISPENMERMFCGEYGDALTITIKNAALGQWNPVTGTDGRTVSYAHPGNSNLGTGGSSLTVSKDEGGYTVTVENGASYTASTAAQALEEAGYAVTDLAKYSCIWALNEEDEQFILDGGEQRSFMVYATVKDTFQMLSADWPNNYPSSSTVLIKNEANIYGPKDQRVGGDSASCRVRREARIDKDVYLNGKHLGSAPKANDGDVLDYRLDFTHYGTGNYKDLPMVDDLYGSQYLLVPVESNPDLTGLEVWTDDEGAKYYKLKEGEYTNVAVGVDDGGNILTAASISVAMADGETEVVVGDRQLTYTGLHTRIKWYFPELDGGNYRFTVRYKAVVDLDLTGVSYTIGNVVWMNDRTGSRIYDALWGGGSIIDFQKNIVTSKGASYKQDVLDEDDYSLVSPGEELVYRLTLHNTGSGSFVLNCSKLGDALPDTLNIFRWEKGVNVTDFRVETAGDVTYTGLEAWYLGDSYAGLLGDRQYILWPETGSITFNGNSTVYLYFTLSYPEDNEEGDTWSRYAAALGGSMLDNTLYVYRFPSSVTHNLRENGQVLLQKGVYGMYQSGTSGVDTYTAAGYSREFYNSKDSKNRLIVYYVTLYNGGNKRLYLNDLYDRLPEGFSFQQVLKDGDVEHTRVNNQQTIITTSGGINQGAWPLTDVYADDIVYRSAKITAKMTEGILQFSVGAGSGEYAVKYDEELRQYYLDRGEAIVFGYSCKIGLSTETEDSATNTITMPYTDYLDTGLSVIGQDSVYVTAPDSERFADYNDGSRQVKSGPQVLADYGIGDGSSRNWLVSEVTVRRGGIIPGVTKYTESFVNSSGITTKYTNAVGPYDGVNWRVRLHNSGTLSITDWTFTDTMPAPYRFEGAVTYQICDGDGAVWSTGTLVTFPDTRTETETKVIVKYGSSSFTVPLDGSWVNLVYGGSMQIAMGRENGNEYLKIRVGDSDKSIPEGGYADVFLLSRNMSNSFVNTVYTNEAMLTPNVQEFSTVQQGSMVKDENGKPVAARNSSPVTVSFGYATSSQKRVTELANPENTAVSTEPENNAILLSDKENEFIYTLTVGNDTEKAMTRLVIIDNLPEPGDHSPFNADAERGSEFSVSLAENPEFRVTVLPEDGEEYELALQQDYTVQYSTSTDFGGPQSADWNGENTGTAAAWSSDPAGARSFRIVIRDEEGTRIPPNARVSVTFRAKASGQVSPGQCAWNSFGYHYALLGITTELEAMPLPVGVKAPNVPSLEKWLVNDSGQQTAAPKDVTFEFLLYEGAALEGSYDSNEALLQALNEAGRSFKQFDMTVKAGQTHTEPVFLEADDWQWTDGQQYTIVELPTEENYAFRSFNGTGAAAYTFTYDPALKLGVSCENTFLHWTVSLTKEDGEGNALPGAVFALYSPVETDRIQPSSDYSGLEIQTSVEKNGQLWYLARVGRTGEDGKLEWSELLRDSYYLLEIKAPDGYTLADPAGQVLYRSGAKEGVYPLTVINYAGYQLPESGGTGTINFCAAGGILLLLSAACLFLKKRMSPGGRKQSR